ncbi:copper resistance D family protein [Metabacillus malikii]|uniref:Copper resistance protein D n=1 Tax=Metabacillus malikii TaxID=1504265 RepID=A0ABT9ZBP7_9BACI|nr:CopD family protein [Metabacillus malikii]MDQ0229425.1 putative copper resistance protein D [Metabacillus malikii]
MDQIIPLTEYITYMLFAYLVGHVALQFVPETKKPQLKVSKQSLLLAVLGIIVFSFFPTLQVITFFSPEGLFTLTSYSILTEFQIGIAWLYGSFFAVFLWMVLYVEGSKYIQAVLLFIMIISIGYASHSSALSFWPGLLSHSTHFLVITLWVGILLHVGWLSQSSAHWHSFLRWFTPLSIIFVMITIASGIYLMLFVMTPRDYMNSWALPYGQMLLLKHISIIPVFAFAFINGFLSRKVKIDKDYDPKKWIQAETIILMVIFFVTGVLGTLPPPHQVNATVLQEGPAAWIHVLLGQQLTAPFTFTLTPVFQGSLLLIIGVIFLALIIVSFYKRLTPWLALCFGLLFIVAVYLGLMLSIQIN